MISHRYAALKETAKDKVRGEWVSPSYVDSNSILPLTQRNWWDILSDNVSFNRTTGMGTWQFLHHR